MSDTRYDNQDTALEAAFIAGTLPEEDRRAPDEQPAPPLATVAATTTAARAFDITASIADGYTFTCSVNGWDVVSPTGGHGNGPSPEAAVLNIGAQIVPAQREDYTGRVLLRVDGSEVQLDRADV